MFCLVFVVLVWVFCGFFFFIGGFFVCVVFVLFCFLVGIFNLHFLRLQALTHHHTGDIARRSRLRQHVCVHKQTKK